MTDRELMRQALDALEDIFGKNKIDVGVINRLRERLAQPEMAPAFRSSHAYNVGFKDGLAAQQIQTVPAKGGLVEKVPAKGTLLEQTLKKAWDEMPHTALMDALVGGTGVMLGDKRIDPASIYKQREPVAWMTFDAAGEEDDIWYENPDGKLLEGWTYKPLYTSPRQWQGLTDEDREEILRWVEWKEVGSQPVAPQKLIAYVERKLREKNT